MIPSCTRETDHTNPSKTGLTGIKCDQHPIKGSNFGLSRHSSIFLTDDEKEGRGGEEEDEMPDLPEEIESFQEEDMEDAITGKKEDEEGEGEETQKKDEL